jgi:hypothetical protein
MTQRGRRIGVGAVVLAIVAGAGVWGALALGGNNNATTRAATPHPDTAVSTKAQVQVAASTVVHGTTCAGCKTEFSAALPDGAHLDGVLQTTGDDVLGWIDYYSGNRLVQRSGLSAATPQDYDAPTAGHCQVVSGVQRCAVSFAAGAHSGGVDLVRVTPGVGTTTTDRVIGDSAGASIGDLDHDGVSDAALEDSTFEPDYASAPNFWHTYVQRNGKLVSTGCDTPTTQPRQAPTTALTGTCTH